MVDLTEIQNKWDDIVNHDYKILKRTHIDFEK